MDVSKLQSAIFFITDGNNTILSASDRAKEILGLGDGDLRDIPCNCLIEGLSQGRRSQDRTEIFQGFLNTQEGRLRGSIVYSPIKDADWRVVGGIWNFITGGPDCQAQSDELLWATKNKTMDMTFQRALIAAKTSATITILGETGTGKTELARFIHRNSRTAQGPFIHINCSAIPETLFESELFGHEKGAFTGAGAEKKGYVALADGGTLFLDEIADMPLNCQSKLLTFLDSGKFRPLGDTKERTSHVRLISSSNRPLWEMTQTNEFRLDLFFRLSVVRLFVPPLRERKEDIPSLVNHFLKGKKGISPSVMALFLSHPWHGNIRELYSLLECGLVCSGESDTILPEHLCFSYNECGCAPAGLTDEKQNIINALKSSTNKASAAGMLGFSRTTLWRKMKKNGIDRNDPCRQ